MYCRCVTNGSAFTNPSLDSSLHWCPRMNGIPRRLWWAVEFARDSLEGYLLWAGLPSVQTRSSRRGANRARLITSSNPLLVATDARQIVGVKAECRAKSCIRKEGFGGEHTSWFPFWLKPSAPRSPDPRVHLFALCSPCPTSGSQRWCPDRGLLMGYRCFQGTFFEFP